MWNSSTIYRSSTKARNTVSTISIAHVHQIYICLKGCLTDIYNLLFYYNGYKAEIIKFHFAQNGTERNKWQQDGNSRVTISIVPYSIKTLKRHFDCNQLTALQKVYACYTGTILIVDNITFNPLVFLSHKLAQYAYIYIPLYML